MRAKRTVDHGRPKNSLFVSFFFAFEKNVELHVQGVQRTYNLEKKLQKRPGAGTDHAVLREQELAFVAGFIARNRRLSVSDFRFFFGTIINYYYYYLLQIGGSSGALGPDVNSTFFLMLVLLFSFFKSFRTGIIYTTISVFNSPII